MNLKFLGLRNFRGISQDRVYFDKDLTVFAGKNGSGKSTILEALALMLSWVGAKVKGYEGTLIEDKDISFLKNFCELEILLSASDNAHEDVYFKVSKLRGDVCKFEGIDSLEKCCAKLSNLSDEDFLPVIAYYGAFRDKHASSLILPEANTNRLAIYHGNFSSYTNFEELIAFLIRAYSDKHLRKIYDTFKDVLGSFAENYQDMHLDEDMLTFGHARVPAQYMSRGEKTVLALLGDIFLKVMLANPKVKNALHANGIILIDELDLHLHPEWQSLLAKKLPELFEDIQFIISSHSPSVLSVSKNLYTVNHMEKSVEQVESQYGRLPSHILDKVLNAGRPLHIQKEIDQVYKALDLGNLNLVDSLIAQLNDKIPSDPEVLQLEYMARALMKK